MQEKLRSFPPIDCTLCANGDSEFASSLFSFHKFLREFVKRRSSLWVDLSNHLVTNKILSCGRLIMVSLPDRNISATFAIVLKVVKLNFFNLSISKGKNCGG